MEAKHSQCKSCDNPGKIFSSEDELEVHKEKVHMEYENEKDTSFVFSEYMLDKFI